MASECLRVPTSAYDCIPHQMHALIASLIRCMLTHWDRPIDEAEALRLAAEAGAAAAPCSAVVGNGAVLGEHLESAQSQQQQQQQQHQLPATVARPSYLSPYLLLQFTSDGH